MLVQYMGNRPSPRSDNLYQTGEWVSGQIKDVPDAVAAKMLRHPDVYVLAGERQGVIEVVEGQPLETDELDEEAVEDARMSIDAMGTKNAVYDFVQTNFNQELDRRSSLRNMKEEAIRLIDQFGLPR